MPKLFRSVKIHEPKKHGTTIGRKPITSTMNKHKRKSFCARSAGQMKKFPKAAKDPNSRLRQARRRWNC